MKAINRIHFPDKFKGQSMIEFGVGLLVILILLAGLVDVGRMIFTYITLRDSAQEAASFGSVYPTHCWQVEDRALSSLDDPGSVQVQVMINNKICTAASQADACLGNPIQITLTNPNFPVTMPLIGAFIGGQTVSLSATVTDTIIRTPCRPNT